MRRPLRDLADRVRSRWLRLSRWGPIRPGEPPCVAMGKKPIRPAIRDPIEATEEVATGPMDRARDLLGGLVASWPAKRPRLAVQADTGTGKTHAALDRCARHVVGGIGVKGAILVVVHSLDRVRDVVALTRERVAARGGDPASITDLLGRQPVDPGLGEDWSKTRFGCMATRWARRSGSRGRRVALEVCAGACPFREACRLHGYLGDTQRALEAHVIVTTVQRLISISEKFWRRVGAVVCDEDVMPGLMEEVWILPSDLRRAVRSIESAVAKARSRGRTLPSTLRAREAILPLLRAVEAALKGHGSAPPAPLVSLLPEACEGYATAEGARLLQDAMPKRRWKVRGVSMAAPDERVPAPWELHRSDHTPRQVFGRLLTALRADLTLGQSARAATVRVVRTRHRVQPHRLHIQRFSVRTIRRLRQRPLLLLDATLHPAIGPILDVERETIRYDQGRRVIQVLTTLHTLTQLRVRHADGGTLTDLGRRAVARIAAFVAGRHGYVLCRKALVPLLEAEARRYYELRRVRFVTPKNERGWDADERARVFVVLGRYARDEDSCTREAHALRSVYLQLTGSTDGLDRLERPWRWQIYKGRGVPLRYLGELVERKTKEPEDRLAALIQDADRVATVIQFIGRDRRGRTFVLLLRGDATVAADALVKAEDLAEALPANGHAAKPRHSATASTHAACAAEHSPGDGQAIIVDPLDVAGRTAIRAEGAS